MGAKIAQEEAMCYIDGPTPLHGARVYATDLRCGAALIVAALIADGVTEIGNVYHIDRGYENIDHKLIYFLFHLQKLSLLEITTLTLVTILKKFLISFLNSYFPFSFFYY